MLVANVRTSELKIAPIFGGCQTGKGRVAPGAASRRGNGRGKGRYAEQVTTPRILLVNGPNLNLLGTREPAIYGHDTLDDVVALVTETAAARGVEVRAIQSNHEGMLLDAIHAARSDCVGIVINPGGLTHTSVVLRDALSGVSLPVAEIHVSNVYEREAFRHHSYVADVAVVHVIGEGVAGYATATNLLLDVVSGAREG